MLNLIFFVLFLAAVALIFYGANAIISALAYDKAERQLHCRIIPILFIVLLASTNVYSVSLFIQGIDKIINAPGLAQFFSAVMPNRAYELVYMLLMLIGLNFIVVLLTLVTIVIVKIVFANRSTYVDPDDYLGIERILHFPWIIAKWFYNESNDEIKLNSRGHVFGVWAKGFKFSFLIIWIAETVILAISIIWGKDGWNSMLLSAVKSWYMLPMAAFLLFEQIQFFLEGILETEAGTYGVSNANESENGSMQDLLDLYKGIFRKSGALLYGEVRQYYRPADSNLGNSISNSQINDCLHPDVLSVIANQLRQCGGLKGENYQDALVSLINGNSINVYDICEGEFLIYLTAYLNFYLAQGKTALLLCRSREETDRLCSAVKAEMQRLNSLYNVWNITTFEGAESNDSISMIVCTFEDFLNYNIREKRADFMNDLFCAIIADGVDVFTKDSIRIERLFAELKSTEKPLQYIAFTGVNNDSLRTAMEQAIKNEVKPYGKEDMYPNTGVLIWAEESYYRLQNRLGIGNSMSPFMGTALPVSLVAVKYDVPRVFILGDGSRGDRSFDEVLSMSNKEVLNYTDSDMNIAGIIRYRTDEVVKDQDLSMIVSYDTDYNLFNVLWKWSKYGGKRGSLIHIISPSYLLREYFVSNITEKHLALKNNEFDALITYYLGMKKSHMAVLLVYLSNEGVTEAELMKKSREFDWGYDNVEQLLADCLHVIMKKEEIHSIYECFTFEEKSYFNEDRGEFEKECNIVLTNTLVKKRIKDYIGCVSLVTKDNQEISTSILRGNVHNYYLRNQLIVQDGYIYQIRGINDGKVYAEQCLPADIPEYYQISNIELNNYTLVDNCMNSAVCDFKIYTAEASRRIFGYWSSNKGNDFSGDSGLALDLFSDENGSVCIDNYDCVNVLEIKIRKDVLGNRSAEATRLMAFLLKELSKTLFPATHNNLFVAVKHGINANTIESILKEGKGSALNDVITSIIPSIKINGHTEDDKYETVYVLELSCIEYGMVQMMYNKYKNIFIMLKSYLDWYVAPESTSVDNAADSQEAASADTAATKTTKGKFLNFGMSTVPEVFDISTVISFLNKMLPDHEKEIEGFDEVLSASFKKCTFCGKPSMYPTDLGDGRFMCGHCKDHQLTQKDEIKSLFAETLDIMCKGYSITIPKNIHVRFQMADAIAKEAGASVGERILGFYNSSNNQLWLESRGPRIAMQSTVIHELTHAWQFNNKEFTALLKRVLRKYPRKKRALIRLLLVEGHAVFVEIATMERLHEKKYAERLHEYTMLRYDEYGMGYRLLRDYIIRKQSEGSHMTPFTAMLELLKALSNGEEEIKFNDEED